MDALDSVRSAFTITNPDAPGPKSVSFNVPDFDKEALPGFVRDMKVTVGLTPIVRMVTSPLRGSCIDANDTNSPDRCRKCGSKQDYRGNPD